MRSVTDPKTYERSVPQTIIDYLVEGNSPEDLARLYAQSLCPFEFNLLVQEVKEHA